MPRPEEILIPLHIEFLPEPNAVAALAQQIKSNHRAYPIYGLGRMFLNKPERHRVRVTSNAPSHPLFQVGEDGPVTTSRQAAEREAFRAVKASYYAEETQQLEAPKGNYTNVARCRLSGVLLGPTNHHGYQPALRRLYEARFSRRMDFNEFLRQIEVVNDPVVIEEWKTQVSSVTIFRTKQEAEPVEFKSVQEVATARSATPSVRLGKKSGRSRPKPSTGCARLSRMRVSIFGSIASGFFLFPPCARFGSDRMPRAFPSTLRISSTLSRLRRNAPAAIFPPTCSSRMKRNRSSKRSRRRLPRTCIG